jgi:anaphase-promoting complex subunit 11
MLCRPEPYTANPKFAKMLNPNIETLNRLAFDGCCPDCKMPGDDCPIVWGECSHPFHMHCIVKWINSQVNIYIYALERERVEKVSE